MEAALWSNIDRLLDKLDKKTGKARLPKPSRRTILSSWERIRIELAPLGMEPVRRSQRAMTRKQLARMVAK
jgi:hypothetical protein